ncbi:MAG: copper amine oxidase domain protein [Lachnospiraceae bacterium]|jgi:hypothetical protein|nr:copper amine oxidase domain protein [Lachnospiraceae bacterium]
MKKICAVVILIVLIFSVPTHSFGASDTNTYTNEKYEWSINIVNELEMSSDTDVTVDNETHFATEDGNLTVAVKMYSKEGLTLEKWVDRELKSLKDNYNSKYVKVIKTETTKINKIAAKKIYVKMNISDTWITKCYTFLVGKSYRYAISYSMPSNDYSVASKRGRIEGVISSFKIGSPNSKEIGVLPERQSCIDSSEYIRIGNAQVGWELSVPDTWEKVFDSGVMCKYQVANEAMYFVFILSDAKNKTLEAFADEVTYVISDTADQIIRKQIQINGYDCIELTIPQAQFGYKVKEYLLIHNENAYRFSIRTAHYVDIPKHDVVADNIIKSLELSEPEYSNGQEDASDSTYSFEGTTKEKFGDSYYKWSMNTPINLKVLSRTENEDETVFSAGEDDIFLMISTYKNENNETLDIISTGMKNYANEEGYSILKSETTMEESHETYRLAYKDENFITEWRVTIADGKVYAVGVLTDEEDYQTIGIPLLDSFSLSFVDDGKTEDISSINQDGYRVYNNSQYGFSLEVLPEWQFIESQDGANKIYYSFADMSYTFAKMYSREEGMTLDSLVTKKVEEMNKKYNKKSVKISAVQNVKINGVKCKRVNIQYNLNYGTYHECFIYAVGKNYRYEFGYYLDDKAYHNSELLAEVENSLKSFKFTEPNAKLVGKLQDPETLEDKNEEQVISSEQYKWSVKLPGDFFGTVNYEDNYMISHSKYGISVTLIAEKASDTLNGYVSQFEKEAKTYADNYTVKEVRTFSEKGVKVKRITYKYAENERSLDFENTLYIIIKNGIAYHIYFEVPVYCYSNYNIKVIDTIWKSIKI